MAPLTCARLGCIPFPLPLPVDEDINILAFDQDTLDRKLQLDVLKHVEIAVNVSLNLVEVPGGQEEGFHPAAVPLHVGFPKRFDRLVDAEDSVVVVFILKGFPATPRAQHKQNAQEEATD